jgi:hypothetical protein
VSRRAWSAFAIALSACGKPSAPPEPRPAPAAPAVPAAATPAAAAPATGCERLPFAADTPVPEASGAAWMIDGGQPRLLVIGDSGNHGAYGILDPETGATLETGALPLTDRAGDDLEGLAAHGDLFYAVISSGWIRSWRRAGKGFALVDGPYPLGPVDLPDTKHNASPPTGDGMVCGAHAVNCGRNYEGLCLAHAAKDPGCVGFVASKADGHLYCLSEDAGKLVVHHERAIAISRPGALADCAFSDDDTLYVGSNMFDLANVYRVDGWADPAHATLTSLGSLGVGFPEGMAVHGDVIYRTSDTGGAPSLLARYRCAR